MVMILRIYHRCVFSSHHYLMERWRGDMVREPAGDLNVVIVSFDNERDANQALTALQELDAAGHVEVGEAGVIQRTTMGWVSPRTHREKGFVERLRDVLDGPNKVTTDDKAAAVAFIGRKVQPESFALIAAVAERDGEAVINDVMTKLGGAISRRPAIDVFTELEEAREEEERRAANRAKAQKKLDEMLEKRRRK
jgi:hypothetical protein